MGARPLGSSPVGRTRIFFFYHYFSFLKKHYIKDTNDSCSVNYFGLSAFVNSFLLHYPCVF